jgi:outer membrane protein OmpA-like peptidoglycan-associated protein
MKIKAFSGRSILGMMAVAMCLQAQAQPILTGKDLTEENLIESLEPSRERGSAAPDPSAPKPAASLLITFVTNSADLAEPAKSTLSIIAKALQSPRLANFKFQVEGHADPRGSAEYNRRLSQARAESVVRYLAAEHNIARSRLKPVGKGATELYKPQQPDAPENRRVTLVTVLE